MADSIFVGNLGEQSLPLVARIHILFNGKDAPTPSDFSKHRRIEKLKPLSAMSVHCNSKSGLSPLRQETLTGLKELQRGGIFVKFDISSPIRPRAWVAAA